MPVGVTGLRSGYDAGLVTLLSVVNRRCNPAPQQQTPRMAIQDERRRITRRQCLVYFDWLAAKTVCEHRLNPALGVAIEPNSFPTYRAAHRHCRWTINRLPWLARVLRPPTALVEYQGRMFWQRWRRRVACLTNTPADGLASIECRPAG